MHGMPHALTLPDDPPGEEQAGGPQPNEHYRLSCDLRIVGLVSPFAASDLAVASYVLSRRRSASYLQLLAPQPVGKKFKLLGEQRRGRIRYFLWHEDVIRLQSRFVPPWIRQMRWYSDQIH